MKIVNYKDKPLKELESSLLELKKKLCQMRFDLHAKTLTNTSLVRKLKVEIARVKTCMKEKTINEVKNNNA